MRNLLYELSNGEIVNTYAAAVDSGINFTSFCERIEEKISVKAENRAERVRKIAIKAKTA